MAEELVALETAKMLIKKGFNECRNVVDINNMSNGDLPKRCFSQPTQSLAQKWLREVKNLHIEIYRNACGYGYIIVKANNGTWMKPMVPKALMMVGSGTPTKKHSKPGFLKH